MSDAPLFQNSDEQEATYAPQTPPTGDREATTATGAPMVPILNPTGLGGGASAETIGATTAGNAPLVPADARAMTADDDTDAANRRAETGGSTQSST